jgi:glycosyltransferase involved in cell wall biosynthesis
MSVPGPGVRAAGDGSRPLRVAILMNQLGDGGTPSRVLELARALAPGVELRVVAFAAPSARMVAEYRRAGLDPVVLPGRRDPRSVPALWAFLRGWRPDVLHTFHPLTGCAGRLLGRGARVPAIVSSYVNVPDPRRPVVRALDRLTRGLADQVVCNSEAVERARFGSATPLGGEGPVPRVVTIVNGIDVEALRRSLAAADRGAVRAELGAAPGDAVLACVARFIPVKDHPTLLRAFAALAAERRPVRLWLVGWGPAEGELRAMAAREGVAERVRFVVGTREVGRYLAGADLFVLASLREGLSGALLEAMAAGLPAVVSDIAPNLRVVGDAAGVAFAVGDPQALAAAVRRVLDAPGFARELGARGRERVEQQFSVRRVAGAYLRVYAAALERARARRPRGVPAG